LKVGNEGTSWLLLLLVFLLRQFDVMESPPPKPVITYFGDVAVLSSVLQKKLQGRIRQSQVHSLSRLFLCICLSTVLYQAVPIMFLLFREDPPYSCFNAFCEGVEFLHFPSAKERLKGGDCPIYQRPALHTFWCSCYVSLYCPLLWIAEYKRCQAIYKGLVKKTGVNLYGGSKLKFQFQFMARVGTFFSVY